jgi:hypothetical protein
MAEEEVRTLSPNGIVLETIENGWSAAYPRYPELVTSWLNTAASPITARLSPNVSLGLF